MMRFFFLQETPDPLEGPWHPPQDLSRHLKALRIQAGVEFLLLLPHGGAIAATMDSYQELQLLGLREIPKLPLMPITLATAWPKGTRGEELIRRASEAGVERILPLRFERSVAGIESLSLHKIRRLEKIAQETCQQCRRPRAPVIHRQPLSPQQALEEFPTAHPILLVPGAWPLVMELGLHSPKEVLLFVGPEGGLTSDEIDWFQERNIAKVGLLPTILRIESAGPMAAGLCQHWFFQLDEGAS
jgi:16S rRNA (uracil1498-N3)-methyltransferase